MLSTTNRVFVLVMDNQVDAIAKDWDDMRGYCSETEKHGEVFVVETVIPFGKGMDEIVTTKKFFGKV